MKREVRRRHIRCYEDPIKLETGEPVVLERRDPDWPGWVWCKGKDGRCGWVPLSYLQVSENSGRTLRSYDATELSAEAGDVVEVGHEESGWFWCTDSTGRAGWLPRESIEGKGDV